MTFENKLMDRIGRKLLTELQMDARLSYAELGRRVGLTAPAVIERMRQMEDAGIILGYHADIDNNKVGMPVIAFIQMTVFEHTEEKAGELIRELKEVIDCYKMTGGITFMIKVAVPTIEDLDVVISKLRSLGSTSTSIVLAKHTERNPIRSA